MVAKLRSAIDHNMAQPPMTPMIDVVFQMLIFFMVGMQIREPEGQLSANLPKGSGPEKTTGTIPSAPPQLHIRLVKDVFAGSEPRIFFEQYECADIADLEARLIELGEAMSAIPVVLDSGEDVPFKSVLGALNACTKARFTQISFKAAPQD